MNARRFALALVKLVALAFGLALAILYLKLGFFVGCVWGFGAAAALALTVSLWSAARPRWPGAVVVLVAYMGLASLAWQVLAGRRTEATFRMSWESRGAENHYGEAEVVLTYVDHPAHYVRYFSDDLLEHLSERGENPVEVGFVVTKDLGRCVRGFLVVEVGGLASWSSAWSSTGHAGPSDPSTSPWPEPWWCP